MAGPGVVQVQTAAGSEDEAGRIADALLDARLAACVQVVGPVTSRYWWQGRQETATEWLCLVKTTADLAAAAAQAVRDAHSYEVPEVIVTPVVDGAADYLAWVAGEVRQ